MKTIEIYTDGSCLGNPGLGGIGAVLTYKEHKREISTGFKFTTNNRMELKAAIEALKAIKEPSKVKLHTDSRYVIDGTTKWIENWIAKSWKDSKRKPVKNKDLWLELIDASNKHDIEWIHVKAHSGVELNERCDQLAKEAANSKNLIEDFGYQSKY